MLSPEARHLLTDALRPPQGFRVEVAVATTYSLDLTAVLLAPLSFALFDRAGASSDDLDATDPVRLLEAVRRHAEHTTVFCQAGAIHVPRQYRSILVFAEGAVREVNPAIPGRVFHPKIWVLRYRSADGETRHRFLCLSRNLTFDKSWDTLLRLDESDVAGEGFEAPDPEPLALFLQDLPTLCTRPLSEARRAQIEDLAQSVGDAHFDLPEPFDQLEFWPLGSSHGRAWPFPGHADRVLAISAFADATILRRLQQTSDKIDLISRAETLDRLGSAVFRATDRSLVLQRMAESDFGEVDAASLDDPVSGQDRPLTEHSPTPQGLHAKTYVMDNGDRSTVFTGSANATRAAFGGNVEFGVVLEGATRACGVKAVLDDAPEAPGLSRLITPYTIQGAEAASDPRDNALHAAEVYHQALAFSRPRFDVHELDEDRFRLTLSVDCPTKAPGPTRVWPITLPRGVSARRLRSGIVVTWGPLAVRSLTPFLAVETEVSTPQGAVSRACVVEADLIGDVPSRRQQVLTDILRTQLDVLRYLVFLLGDPAYDALLDLAGDEERQPWRFRPGGARVDLALFEPLVRAVTRDDEAIERVASLVTELRATEAGAKLVPDGFEDVWQAVWEVRQEVRR